MNQLQTLARHISADELDVMPVGRFELVKRHIVDSVGARLAGSRTDEGEAAGRVASAIGGPVMAAVVAACAQTRCTEADDIHLESCTTPGSVVVPAVLALVTEGLCPTMGACAAAALAGYEAMIRLGVAIDGPRVLLRGTWPTGYAAPFGAAAAASRAFGLDARHTAGALATALALSSRAAVPAAAPASSRWVALGIAAANGLAAAEAARGGLLGDAPEPPKIAAGLGRRWLFDRIGMKPHPTARQALAAVEAAHRIVHEERLDPEDVDGVAVSLPEPLRRIVDRPDPPGGRFASIVSVQYQIALALVDPARLMDVRRTPPFVDNRIRALMKNVKVRRARDLERAYPRLWPARVEVRTGGRRFVRLVRFPHGDARRPLSWDDVGAKFRALAGPVVGVAEADRFVEAMRAATPGSSVPVIRGAP